MAHHTSQMFAFGSQRRRNPPWRCTIAVHRLLALRADAATFEDMNRNLRRHGATALTIASGLLGLAVGAFQLEPRLMPSWFPRAVVGYTAIVAGAGAIVLGWPWLHRVRVRWPVYLARLEHDAEEDAAGSLPARTPDEIRGTVKQQLRSLRRRAQTLRDPDHHRGWLEDLVADVEWNLQHTHRSGFKQEFREAVGQVPRVEWILGPTPLGSQPQGPTPEDVRAKVETWLEARIDKLHVDDLNPEYDGRPLRRRITSGGLRSLLAP